MVRPHGLPPNITFDRTAGAHSLAAAGQRDRQAHKTDPVYTD